MRPTLLNLSVQYSIVGYQNIVVQQISRTYIYFLNDTLSLLISNSSFSFLPPSSPGNHHSSLDFYEFDYFRYIQVESYSICRIGLFH